MGRESIYPRPDLGGELNPPPNTIALPQPDETGHHHPNSARFFTKKFLVLQNLLAFRDKSFVMIRILFLISKKIFGANNENTIGLTTFVGMSTLPFTGIPSRRRGNSSTRCHR
ncbi:hypothetical protein LEP1GSC195_2525 [Leptospira wolbachii serovar Codice str. CDC]|uniref:Uncharacterized protein n=1 Tax=Leptospira wolbachii serovar Codice str. CDC TaxID=1218599 RepID=R9A493_9LEPT|nr:hypothetical protein LEP1GSC195_2525 [Leptospira wolbachii serovar Codice str. CDC]